MDNDTRILPFDSVPNVVPDSTVSIERQLTENLLRESEIKFREIFEQAAVGMALVTPEGKFFQVNGKFCDLTGYSKSKLLKKSIIDITHPDELANYGNYQQKIYQMLTGELVNWEFEKRFLCKEGLTQWVKITVTPIKNKQKKLQHFLIFIEDIQSQKCAEQQLRYRLLLESALSLVSRELMNDTANLNRVLEFLGVAVNASRSLIMRCRENTQEQQMHIRIMYEWCDTQTRPEIDNYRNFTFPLFSWWMKQITNNENVLIPKVSDLPQEADFEKNLLSSIEVTSLLFVPIFNSLGKLWGQIGIDTTGYKIKTWTEEDAQMLRIAGEMIYRYYERKQLREQEIIQRQELARSNQDLEQFAHIVSHDLQAPLATVISYAQLLNKYYQHQLDEKASSYLKKLINGTRHMSQQIDDLLKYSRVSTQQQPLQFIDLNWVVQQAIANLQYAIQKQQATIQVEYPLPTLMADRTQLVHLFQNLISNAIKYRKDENPKISIRVMRKEDDWLLAISDNGIGIDPKYHQRIFQIFQRLHTQQDYPGTGIGLAICQRIVQRHQGSIWVESNLGQGSTFYFTLRTVSSLREDKSEDF